MDGEAAIEHNRQALKRILAAIVAMTGVRIRFAGSKSKGPVDLSKDRTPGAIAEGRVGCRAEAETGDRYDLTTLPRRLRLAVLRLLRPAESAARRLIIAMARGLVVTLPPPRPHKASRVHKKVSPLFVRNGVGTGIVLPSGVPLPAAPAHLIPPAAAHRQLAFALIDPPRRWRRRALPAAAAGIPRIGVPGITERLAVAIGKPPTPDDPVDAARLGRRLEALASALDDLAGEARRFARWQARRDRLPAQGLVRHRSPLRSGRPPGGRLSRYDPAAARPRNVREVDEVLVHAHALAVYALERADTS